MAAPSDAARTREALAITFVGAITPDLKTDFQRFIDFRQNEKNERARREYIEQLTSIWENVARGGSNYATKQIADRVADDLRKARKSYFQCIGAPLVATQGLTSLGAVIPLLVPHIALAAIVGALLTVSASVVTVTVRNDAPMYLRAAIKSELVAPTAL